MKFEERPVARSEGWTLAHSVACGVNRINKGTLVTPVLINRLVTEGVKNVQVFLLEDGDLNENLAAQTAAKAIAGAGLTVELAGRGRTNIVATEDGLFIPGDGINTVNATDDAFSAASLPAYSSVRAGQLVATIKLVPYGLPAEKLKNIDGCSEQLTVKPFYGFTAALIVTGNAPTKKTLTTLTSRIEHVGGTLEVTPLIEHSQAAVCGALKQVRKNKPDLILMLGASAISDRRDIVPAALAQAGGELIKLGMPADPGNLLMLGKLGSQTVIGLPGCARSPALNGFDWVLERFAAQEPLNAQVLTKMGIGGLLKEPVGRTVPRATPANQPRKNQIESMAAVVLAAGKSSRSRNSHKLLSFLGTKTVVRTTVDNLLGVKDLKIVVVTGNAAEKIEACLPGNKVSIVHNPDFENGMGTSLAAGVSELGSSITHALIFLADMPFVTQATVEKLLKSATDTNDAAIFIPTFHGKRGHPVLWHQKYFSLLRLLKGDAGGRKILEKNSEKVIEVPVDDPGILIDLDTPEMLAQFGIMPIDR